MFASGRVGGRLCMYVGMAAEKLDMATSNFSNPHGMLVLLDIFSLANCGVVKKAGQGLGDLQLRYHRSKLNDRAQASFDPGHMHTWQMAGASTLSTWDRCTIFVDEGQAVCILLGRQSGSIVSLVMQHTGMFHAQLKICKNTVLETPRLVIC